MLATLAFGLVLVGALAAFVVIADSGLRSWSAVHAIRKELDAGPKAMTVPPRIRTVSRRMSVYRPLSQRAMRQRAA